MPEALAVDLRKTRRREQHAKKELTVVRTKLDGVQERLSLATYALTNAVRALALSESDLQGVILETKESTQQHESNTVSFKNADGSYNDTISILCAQLATVGGMSAATLSRNMKTIIEDVTGKTLDPSNKFSQHFMSDQIYLAEALSQEGVKTIMEEDAAKKDAAPWVAGHDGTGVFGNELMHYNVTVGGQDLTLGIIPVAAKFSDTMKEGFEKVCADVLGDSTTIPTIGTLNAIHSQLGGTLNDTAGSAKKFSKILVKEKLDEVRRVPVPNFRTHPSPYFTV